MSSSLSQSTQAPQIPDHVTKEEYQAIRAEDRQDINENEGGAKKRVEKSKSPIPSTPLVFIESPYSGDIDRHVRYLMLCGFDSYQCGEMYCSSHSQMTQHPAKADYFVSDYKPEWDVFTRDEAIDRAHVLRNKCDKVVFYIDLGWSSGMKAGRQYCDDHDIPYEIRKVNKKNILNLKGPNITSELIEAIVSGQDYKKYFQKGTPLLTS